MDLYKRRLTISFSKRLFCSVVSMFLVFVFCVFFFQHKREGGYQRNLLNARLEGYNTSIAARIQTGGWKELGNLRDYISRNLSPDLHVIIIRRGGQVVFDNRHAVRAHQEIDEMDDGNFYAVSVFPESGMLVRSSLPNEETLGAFLKADEDFIWFSVIVTCFLVFFFYRYVRRLGLSINQLKNFAQSAEANNVDMDYQFPVNELGDISKSIVLIYKRLKRTKEKLYIEREKLISHLSISREGLAIFRPTKELILSNALFDRYMDLLSDDNLHSVTDFFAISELEPIIRFINREPGCNESMEERRMPLTIEKGGRIFIVVCVVFHDNSFEISINDITQREEQARVKRQLTQNISHELKTPVSSIQGYLETILENPDLPREMMFKFLNRCYAQSNRLTHLLQDISSLNRMDSGAQMIDMENVDIAVIVRSIQREMALLLEERHMKVKNLLPDHLPMQGNSSLLCSVFTNLFSNAISYAGDGKTITIQCFRDDGIYYYFSFADNGVGVAPEHLSRLFERFYRVDKGRSRKLGGTGLGLAIVKNAIHLHGGSISAKIAIGGGLEFVFSLNKNLPDENDEV